ncbi:glycine cleavage system protein H [Streptomyces solincola]|nr:hypothetical protein [Streptomyces solincola]
MRWSPPSRSPTSAHRWRGSVAAVNSELDQSPERINEDCYGEGWIVEIDVADAAAVDKLLDPDQYAELIAQG